MLIYRYIDGMLANDDFLFGDTIETCDISHSCLNQSMLFSTGTKVMPAFFKFIKNQDSIDN